MNWGGSLSPTPTIVLPLHIPTSVFCQKISIRCSQICSFAGFSLVLHQWMRVLKEKNYIYTRQFMAYKNIHICPRVYDRWYHGILQWCMCTYQVGVKNGIEGYDTITVRYFVPIQHWSKQYFNTFLTNTSNWAHVTSPQSHQIVFMLVERLTWMTNKTTKCPIDLNKSATMSLWSYRPFFCR